jgi:uncharacterized membrane protein YczE
MKQIVRRIPEGFLYAAGLMTAALGVNLFFLSSLGAGAWDTVSFALSKALPITVGTAAFVIQGMLALLVVWHHKQWKYLVVWIPIALGGAAIDFWDLIVFTGNDPTSMILRMGLFVLAAFVITFGLAMIVTTGFPATVFEELTKIGMKQFRVASFFKIRIVIELFALALASAIGLWSGIGWGKVNVGSLLLAVAIGPLIQWQMKWVNAVWTRIRRKESYEHSVV